MEQEEIAQKMVGKTIKAVTTYEDLATVIRFSDDSTIHISIDDLENAHPHINLEYFTSRIKKPACDDG